jgi:hypothetical protein
MHQAHCVQHVATDAVEDQHPLERANHLIGTKVSQAEISEMPEAAQLRLPRELVQSLIERRLKALCHL